MFIFVSGICTQVQFEVSSIFQYESSGVFLQQAEVGSFPEKVLYGVCCVYQNITYIILVRGRGVVERYCGSTALMLVLLFV